MARPAAVKPLLASSPIVPDNLIAYSFGFLFVMSERGLAATLTRAVGVKANPIGFAGKFKNVRKCGE